MTKSSSFDDPLQDIDPIMEQAYSVADGDLDNEVDKYGLSESSGLSDLNPTTEEEHPLSEFADEPAHAAGDVEVADIQFPELTKEVKGQNIEKDIFANIPVSVSVELGRSQVSLKEVFELTEGSIIELDRLVGEPLDLVVNGQILAQGEVVAIDNNYGLRVTNILSNLQQ